MTNDVEKKEISEIPETAITSCPLKGFAQRYIVKSCADCEYFQGTALLTDAIEVDTKDKVTGEKTGKRPIRWHERNMIRCAYPMTRRCFDLHVIED